jgi:hypothetical protein
MDIPALVDTVNENAFKISGLIAEEILLIAPKDGMDMDSRLYALAMFYRAAILELEARIAGGLVN